MSKIAIISQPDQGVLIDVSGCTSLQEASQHLTSTLQISSQFWNGMNVDLNLGDLKLTPEEVAQVMSIAAEVGVRPAQVFATDQKTRSALMSQMVKVASGEPMTLPVRVLAEIEESELADDLEIQDSAAQLTIDCQVQPDQEQPPAEVIVEQYVPEVLEEVVDQSQQASVAAPVAASVAAPAAPAAIPVAPAVLYLKQTLRSGQAVSHKGHLVIIGDVNPGAEIMAEGDITVWGALRGIAHAGISGNTGAEIRALRLQAIQLRIAHAIARAPDRPRRQFTTHAGPETARIVDGTIRISANNPE